MAISHFKSSDKRISRETLRIDFAKKVYKGEFTAFKFIDKDTKQAVIYVPAFEMSGYGETFEKADEILKCNLDNYFQHLNKLSFSEVALELKELGWEKSFFNKQFSKAYVDMNGHPQNLNAEGNRVEQIALTAA